MSAGRELIRNGKEGGVRGEWDGRTAKYVKINAEVGLNRA